MLRLLMLPSDVPVPPLVHAARITGVLLERLRSESCRRWPQLLGDFLDELAGIEDAKGEALFMLLAFVADGVRRLAGDRPCPLGDPLDRLLRTWDPARAPRDYLMELRELYLRTADPAACEHRSCSARVRELRQYIDTHFAERLTLEDLARRIRLQKNYAATLFRQETGVTIHRYLTQVRVTRAAARLRRGEKFEAVMLLVGYRSKKSFYQQFRAQMGVTPGAYRLATHIEARAS